MSVLNQMLRDLEARGERPSVAAVQGSASAPRPPLPGLAARTDQDAGHNGRKLLWGFTLLVIAAALVLWQWREQQLRDAATMRTPLGYAQFKGALGDAAAAQAVTAPPIAAAATPGPAVSTAAPAAAVPTKTAVASTPTPIAVQVAALPREPARRRASPVPTPPAPAVEEVVRRTVAVAADPEADVARAAELIARGRATEAAALLRQVLATRPQHTAARRALAALQAEAGLRDAALATLLDGAAVDPARFAIAAASLQFEQGDAAGALATLARVTPATRTPQHHALAAGISQRMGRHEAAVDAYRRALASQATEAVWWIGLGVSLEALGHRADARAAYENAAAIPTMGAELRQFAAQKLSVLAATRKPAGEALVSAPQ